MLSSLRSRAVAAAAAGQNSSAASPLLRFFSSLSTPSPLQPHKNELLGLAEVEKILNDVKADDVKVIPVKDQCGWTDFMVIATGRSTWHVRNIAQALIHKVKEKQKGCERMMLPSVEGSLGGKWIVIDSGSIIIHALDEKAREYYNLESLYMKEKSSNAPSQDLAESFVKTRRINNSKKKPVKSLY
ncbi:hypothetical protein LUZ60_007771 [Juncus effusus]|nr:hypothetical protein LUZ60_007771 [Juncus effusus]